MEIIFITSRFPYPINKGDKLRAYYQIIELAKSNNIHLISLSDKDVKEYELSKLRDYCSSIHVFKLKKLKIILNLFRSFFNNKPFQVNYFYSYKIQKKINQIIKNVQPDHIFCQLIRTALYLKNQHQFPSTIDYMDALSNGIKKRIPLSNLWMKPILKIEYDRLRNFENLAYEFFDNHVIISNSDRDKIPHINNKKINIIPNGIDSKLFQSKEITQKKYDLVFIGNLSYAPNIEAALYISKTIVPELVQDYPNIKVLIAGSNPVNKINKLANKHIDIEGWVEDIKTAYCSGRIFFAPMSIGTGLQNKLLEAMSLEIPCITSKLANNSLKATHNENVLIGNNSDEYIMHIKNCLENKELRNQLALEGRKYVIENFNWHKSNEKLLKLFKPKQNGKE